MARELAARVEWLRGCVVPLVQGRFVLFPWTGSRIYKTLVLLLGSKGWYCDDHHYY
ncbi:hypothetical protein [Ktedonospora formicarum]|uniref:hypothetical protein n=1 Tax=Ktedonospora formicarum TaxID=2778364 RepID=UPI001C68D5CA|nr:hypothetical protein [Ktedonospora formicarum]